MPHSADSNAGPASHESQGSMQVRIVRLKDRIEVDVTGMLDMPPLLELIARLGKLTRESGDSCVLLDLQQVEGEAHVSDQMQVGDQIGKCLRHLRGVASVMPKARATLTSQNVARAQGVRMKVFDDKDAAVAWLRACEPVSDKPSRKDVAPLDPARAAIWAAVQHLFPPHAQAIQLPTGTLAISWPISHKQHHEASYEMATPVTVRLEPDLEESLRSATDEQRKRIAANQEATFRAGMIGYDPYTAVPKARVIVLG